MAATFMSLFVFSYTIRLFERQLQSNFYHITTSMWCVFITMTTVGYGDVYAKSHAGRAITVLCSGIGVVLVSLFVVCLNNILSFDQAQEKSFNLLSRLSLKDSLRVHAVGMLCATYKLKILRRRYKSRRLSFTQEKKLRHEIKMMKRNFISY